MEKVRYANEIEVMLGWTSRETLNNVIAELASFIGQFPRPAGGGDKDNDDDEDDNDNDDDDTDDDDDNIDDDNDENLYSGRSECRRISTGNLQVAAIMRITLKMI